MGESEVARGAVGGVRRRDGDGNACGAKREAGRSKIVRGGSEGLKYNRTLLTPIISLKLALTACISQSRSLAHSFAMPHLRLALLHSSGKNLTRLEWPVLATHHKTPPFSSPTFAGNNLSSHHGPKRLRASNITNQHDSHTQQQKAEVAIATTVLALSVCWMSAWILLSEILGFPNRPFSHIPCSPPTFGLEAVRHSIRLLQWHSS
jgi:hypothetical protein